MKNLEHVVHTGSRLRMSEILQRNYDTDVLHDLCVCENKINEHKSHDVTIGGPKSKPLRTERFALICPFV